MLSKSVIVKAIEKIELIKNKPKLMFIGDLEFDTLINFLYGYLDGISDIIGLNIHNDFESWLRYKTNDRSYLFWVERLKELVSDKKNADKCTVLLNIFKEYFEQMLKNSQDGSEMNPSSAKSE